MKLPPALARSQALLLFLTFLVIGTVLRIDLALTDDGLYWPDEIFQSLEPAHRWVFGYGWVSWEFLEGARTWALPGLVAAVMGLCKVLGFDSPQTYLGAVRLLFVTLSGVTGWGVWRLGRALGAQPGPAAVGSGAFMLAVPTMYFGFRAMSETVSAAFVVWGLVWAWPSHATRAQRVGGAFLLGAAVFFRLQNALFCLGLVAVWLSRRQWKPALQIFGALALSAIAYGVLDKVTWGTFFQSAWVYLRFNLIEGKSSQWGVSEASYYLRVLFRAMPTLAISTVVLLGCAWKKSESLILLLLAFVLLHSAIPHKEYRFVFVLLPIAFAIASVGLSTLPSWKPAALYGAVIVLSAVGFRRLTFGDLGHYENLKPQASAYDDFGALNRLLLKTNQVPDICGLKLEASHIAWSGGYSYLHLPIRFYSHLGPPRTSGFYSHAIVLRSNGLSEVVATEGPFALVRVGTQCREDPHYSDRLP